LGIKVRASGVRVDVSPGSPSSVIGTGVMSETPELSSMSYVVIRCMRTLSTSIQLDVLVSPNYVVEMINDLAYCDIIPGFSG